MFSDVRPSTPPHCAGRRPFSLRQTGLVSALFSRHHRVAAAAVAVIAVAGTTACTAGSAGATAQPPAATTTSAAPTGPDQQPTRVTPHPPLVSSKPLAGKVIGIDPGHNGDNIHHLAYINHTIWNGREHETCDTTGTATNAGYPEAKFTWRVAKHLVRDLHHAGATVVLTRHSNHGYGPCVNKRARILNHAHPAVSIDIHADGAPSGDRGFAILEPVADGPNDRVIRSSERFGRDLKRAMLSHTSMSVSNYDGVNGFNHRDDLAGLNLTTEPKVLIECGNMRDSVDARRLTADGFQKRAAAAMAAAIIRFVKS